MARLTLATGIIVAVLGATLAACTSDNAEDSDPQPKPQPQPQQCDTSNVTFSATLTPIFKANCYSCHSTAIATHGVVLDTYAGVKRQVDDGKLLGVITHAPGYPPMPQGGAKLSDCTIAKIKKWVDDGAPNN
ncbi:hypothetical protein [Pontibacter liquoris]|uniref:hypothetical protein n=1 Tax=Pontibacter liquoris TaxID=2905677 RepID=UPI001FA7D651|nr:hypothetical protein [Pontibacter liquoris]